MHHRHCYNNRITPCLSLVKLLNVSTVILVTRKLSYRKDDRAMRYISVPWKLSRVPEYAHGYFSRNSQDQSKGKPIKISAKVVVGVLRTLENFQSTCI